MASREINSSSSSLSESPSEHFAIHTLKAVVSDKAKSRAAENNLARLNSRNNSPVSPEASGTRVLCSGKIYGMLSASRPPGSSLFRASSSSKSFFNRKSDSVSLSCTLLAARN